MLGFILQTATTDAWLAGLRDFLGTAVPLVLSTAAIVTVMVKQQNLEAWMQSISGRLKALQDVFDDQKELAVRNDEKIRGLQRETEELKSVVQKWGPPAA